MAVFDLHHPWAFTFGVLVISIFNLWSQQLPLLNYLLLHLNVSGNLVSIFVYLAPLPTFTRICRSKSTLGFQSLPYVVALFSAMLWMYYAFLKQNAILLISINLFGCIVETIYVSVFVFYASKEARKHTAKLLASLNVGCFFLVFLLTLFFFKGPIRISVVGWVCVAVSVSVFAAPLTILVRTCSVSLSRALDRPFIFQFSVTFDLTIFRSDIQFQVVRTRSVEFMPFTLSFFLTLSAIMWFAYGLFQRDWCVALPNVFGFFLGLVQMTLYGYYKKAKDKIPAVKAEKKLPEHVINIVAIGKTSEVHPVDSSQTNSSGSDTDAAEDEKKHQEEESDDEVKSHETGVVCLPPPGPDEPCSLVNAVMCPTEPAVLVICAA
ncbi:hypothetical protein RJ640_030897 [Escallonia rubra]|uniref:Bidirectional sugar transporter SWEET n=1 Tax=Escallonia rubra TaxID=112253 RepID=A0AA88S141_9ASTE|nr:hypothetical protein RJ640_030897 [Escallonia rubra]